MGIAVKYRFFLNDIEVNAPLNWQSIQVLATFDQTNVQANISTEEFEFVNESAKLIRGYISGGISGTTNGIYDGMTLLIVATDGASIVNVFEGCLDFGTYEELSPVRVKCSVRKNEGLNQLDERSRAISYGYLRSIGVVTPADYVDVDYVIERVEPGPELATMTLTLFFISLQIAQLAKDIQKEVQTSASITATAGLGSAAAGPAHLVAQIATDAIYLALLIVQFLQLMNDLIELLVSPVRTHKAMTLRRMMEIASDYLGYDYDSNIPELDSVVLLPSKPDEDTPILEGVPNASDFGYTLSEAFEIVNTLTNSRIQVKDNVLHQYSLNDSFWTKNSSYILPDVLDESVKYNNDDIAARTFLSFQTDPNDAWTLEKFTGTNYEVIVTLDTGNESACNLLRGLEEVAIPLALGNHKDKLNLLESLINSILTIVDTGLNSAIDAINAISSKQFPPSTLATNFSSRLNTLKVDQKIHSVAKLVYLEGGRLPDNHRDLFSAKSMWENYHNYNSFVDNDFGGQRRIFTGKKIPFGFSDFLSLIDNSYFTTEDGKIGKVESLRWTLDGDFAEVDYWIEEVFTRNLIETKIEG